MPGDAATKQKKISSTTAVSHSKKKKRMHFLSQLIISKHILRRVHTRALRALQPIFFSSGDYGFNSTSPGKQVMHMHTNLLITFDGASGQDKSSEFFLFVKAPRVL
uniref:(northern house mosquito) hypothetical protein n=1 Tax=Culex pipiens TaxID=7175 RepID=A0A8D8BXG9_CULPI